MQPRKKIILLYLLSSVALILFVLSCFHRTVHIDDAYLGEQAYFLAKLGLVKSELFRGMMNYEVQNFVYHKLYIWQGALITKIFGFNVYYLKAIAGFYFLALVTVFCFFCKQQGLTRINLLFMILLLITCPLIFELSFVFRPDVAVTFWGLVSYYFLFKPETTWKNCLIAGACAGLAAANHLNGLIFISAGCILLLQGKHWKQFFLFSAVAGLIACFYFHDVKSLADLKMLIFQLTNDPMVAHESYGIWNLPIKLITEQKRYFHSPPEIFYSLMILATLVISAKLIWHEKRNLCIYLVALSLSLALLAHGKTSKYLIYLIPLHLVLVGWSVSRQSSKVRTGSIIAFFIVSWFVNSRFIFTKEAVLEEDKRWAQLLLPGSQVLAPITFIFHNIEQFQIHGLLAYEFEVMAGRGQKTAEYLFGRASQFNIKYLLISTEYQKYFELQSSDYPPYRLIKKDYYWLYEKIH